LALAPAKSQYGHAREPTAHGRSDGVYLMSITFTYSVPHSGGDGEDAPEVAFGSWRLEIDGAVDDLFRAASIVRTHAIETGDPVSIRLVRILKNAESPAQIRAAISAFRRWTIDTNKRLARDCIRPEASG
jgi:hypothetical protein